MLIYHMLSALSWQAHPQDEPYIGDTLATEGFIHCTREADRLVQVANHFYRDREGDFVILCLETEQLQSELRWEVSDGHLYPHIYGPIHPAAVVDIIPFPRHPNGNFLPFK